MEKSPSQLSVLFMWLNELQSTYSSKAQAQHTAQAPSFQRFQLTECSLWRACVADVTSALACCWHKALIYVTKCGTVSLLTGQNEREKEGEGGPVSRKKAGCKITDDILTKHHCMCVCVCVSVRYKAVKLSVFLPVRNQCRSNVSHSGEGWQELTYIYSLTAALFSPYVTWRPL